eukprot:2684618-Rhodomonas_salina.1
MSVRGGQVLSGRGVGGAGVRWRDVGRGLEGEVGVGVLGVRGGAELLARDPADHVLSAPTRTRSDTRSACRAIQGVAAQTRCDACEERKGERARSRSCQREASNPSLPPPNQRYGQENSEGGQV